MNSVELKPQQHFLNLDQGVVMRYLALLLIWSSTPLAVVLSIQELHPMWALACRFVLAAPLAYGVLRLMSMTLAHSKQAYQSYAAGALGLWGAMVCCYLGAVSVPSSMIALLFGLAPLLAGVLGRVLGVMQLSWVQWLGMGTAVLGLGVVMGVGQTQQHVDAVGVFWIALAVVCYVVSMFVVQGIKAPIHPMQQTTGCLMLSALCMMLMLPFFVEQHPTHWPSLMSLLAIAYTVVIASVVAMLCYFGLVQKVAPTTVSLTTLLTPILALLLGYFIHHEQLAWSVVLGMLVVLAGLMAYFVPTLNRVKTG